MKKTDKTLPMWSLYYHGEGGGRKRRQYTNKNIISSSNKFYEAELGAILDRVVIKSSRSFGADLKDLMKHSSLRPGGQSRGSIQGRMKSPGKGPKMKCENNE